MEKQIKEMAQILKDYTKKERIMASHPILEDYAELLYKADYRKQEQGEWIYHEAVITDEGLISGYACSLCNAFTYECDFDTEFFHKKFCGNCGAKMKGAE